MAADRSFDVIIVGGGLAGSSLAGILARAGLGILLVEREAQYRDRIRGELTWPWGVAELRQTGLRDVVTRAGCVEIPEMHFIEDRRVADTYRWPADPILGFSHPRLQEELFAWAGSQGATTLRPAKAIAATMNGRPTVTVTHGESEVEYRARLVVGADGKTSAARRWIGGESMADPEHHRFGGVLLVGLKADPRVFYDVTRPETATFSFAAGQDAHRLYLRLTAEQVREIGADRSLEAFVAHAALFLPEGMLDEAEQVGPLGFFPNSDTWASRIGGDGMVLIGDAAGSADPALGHGTSLLFRDVRELSELLLAERDWPAATAEFARRRDAYYQVVRAYDLWSAVLLAETGDEADHRRERHARARQQDAILGGFGMLEESGPDGLTPDEAARRHFFGEDLD